MERVTTEVTRKIWDDSEGVCICVSPDSDSTGMVRVSTQDEKSREWFGGFDFSLPPAIAIAVAKAVIATAQESAHGTTD